MKDGKPDYEIAITENINNDVSVSIYVVVDRQIPCWHNAATVISAEILHPSYSSVRSSFNMRDKMGMVITTNMMIMYHVSTANGFRIIHGFIFIAGIVRNMKQVLNKRLFCFIFSYIVIFILLLFLHTHMCVYYVINVFN